MGKGHRTKNLNKALMHPLRVNLLLRIVKAGRTSPNLLSQELDMNLNRVAYHVRILQDYDAITLVDEKKRRGATEHFYSVNPDSELITHLLGQTLSGADRSTPEEFARRLVDLEENREVSVATAIPVLADSVGREELQAAAAEFTRAIRTVEEASKARAASSQSDLTFLSLGILAFPLLDRPPDSAGSDG